MNKVEKLSLSDEQCIELLPEFANGMLTGALYNAVQQHIAHSPECFDEFKRIQIVREATLNVEGPLEDLLSTNTRNKNLENIFEKIDEFESEQTSNENGFESGNKALEWLKNLANKVTRSWDVTPASARWTIASQAFLLIAAVSILVYQPLSRNSVAPVEYRTLTSPEQFNQSKTAADAGYRVFRVVFHPKSTESDVRNLVLGVGGQITSGPSLSGVYTLAVREQSDGGALQQLRESPWIEFAEPVIHVNP